MGGVNNNINKGIGSPTLQETTNNGNITNKSIIFDISGGERGFYAVYGEEILGFFIGDDGQISIKRINQDSEEISFIELSTTGINITYSNGVDAYTISSPVNKTGLQTMAMRSDLPQVSNNFTDDAAAATGGVPIGGLYHTSGVVKIRLT